MPTDAMSATPLTPAALEAALQDLLTALQGWLNGTLPDDDETFEEHLAAWMHPDLMFIMPSGSSFGRDDWVSVVRESHGDNPRFRFRLTDVRCIFIDQSHGAITCREWQEHARTGPSPLNGRTTTVTFANDGARPRMIFVQQTWLPPEVVTGSI